MTGRERNDDDASTPRTNLGRTHDRSFAVVATLHEHVGPERRDELERRILLELDDGVDHLERCQNIAPFDGRSHRSRGPFEPSDRVVAVHADNEGVAFAPRAKQNVDVARVQQIEYAVGEYDSSRLRAAPFARPIPRHDFLVRVAGSAQKRPSARGWK